jgi:hypothetical protein
MDSKSKSNYLDTFLKICSKSLVTLTSIGILTLAGVNYAKHQQNNKLSFPNISEGILNQTALKLYENESEGLIALWDFNNDNIVDNIQSSNTTLEDRNFDGVFDYINHFEDDTVTQAYDINNDRKLDTIILSSLSNIGGFATIILKDTNFDGFADFHESKVITGDGSSIYIFKDTDHSGNYDVLQTKHHKSSILPLHNIHEIYSESRDFGKVTNMNYDISDFL